MLHESNPNKTHWVQQKGHESGGACQEEVFTAEMGGNQTG